MSLYSSFKVEHPATAVNTCVCANFMTPNKTNIILTKNNLLEVYSIDKENEKMILESTFYLHDNAVSIQKVRLSSLLLDTDSLILSFEKERKVSIVHFDRKTQQLVPISLHYLEDYSLKKGGFQFSGFPDVKVEPQYRCAAMVIFNNKLVIFPFNQGKDDSSIFFSLSSFGASLGGSESTPSSSDPSTLANAAVETLAKVPVEKHIIVNLEEELNIRQVKDICFLEGFFDPTLLILHEETPTWSGRFASERNTCTATAITFDLSQKFGGSAATTNVSTQTSKTTITGTQQEKKGATEVTTKMNFPVIWTINTLPHESNTLVPLRDTAGGGALVLSENSIIHIHGKPTYGIYFNKSFLFANAKLSDLNIPFDQLLLADYEPKTLKKLTSDGTKKSKKKKKMLFDCTAFDFVRDNQIVCSLGSGELVLLTLCPSGSCLKKIFVTKLTNSVPASCMCHFGNSPFIFLGSRVGDSLLLKYEIEKTEKEQKKSDLSTNKKRKREEETTQDEENEENGQKTKKRRIATESENMIVKDEQHTSEVEYPIANVENEQEEAEKKKKEIIDKINLDSTDNFLRLLMQFSGSGSSSFGSFPSNLDSSSASNSDLLSTNVVAEDDFSAFFGSGDTDSDSRGKNSPLALKFSVVDSLINIAPITDITVFKESSVRSTYRNTESFSKNNYQIATCSCAGKSGCICIMTKSLHPEIFLKKSIAYDCSNTFLVKSSPSSVEEDGFVNDLLFLALSNKQTKVFEFNSVDNLLREVSEQTVFNNDNDGMCLTIQSICNSNYIAQITTNSLRIIKKDLKKIVLQKDLTKILSETENSVVKRCEISEPFILVEFRNGSLIILEILQKNENEIDIKIHKEKCEEKIKKNGPISSARFFSLNKKNSFFFSSAAKATPNFSFNLNPNENQFDFKFLLVSYSNGPFEIMDIPSFQTIFFFSDFQVMPSILRHDEEETTAEELKQQKTTTTFGTIEEIGMFQLQNTSEPPFLFLIWSSGKCMVYKAFNAESPIVTSEFQNENQSNISAISTKKNYLRFSKVHFFTLFDPKTTNLAAENQFFRIRNFGSLKGLMIQGKPTSHFIFSDKSALRIHPFSEMNINSFSDVFQNDLSHFIYVQQIAGTSKTNLIVAQFPTQQDGGGEGGNKINFHLTTPWPTQRIHLGETPLKLCYHEQTSTFIVATSKEIKIKPSAWVKEEQERRLKEQQPRMGPPQGSNQSEESTSRPEPQQPQQPQPLPQKPIQLPQLDDMPPGLAPPGMDIGFPAPQYGNILPPGMGDEPMRYSSMPDDMMMPQGEDQNDEGMFRDGDASLFQGDDAKSTLESLIGTVVPPPFPVVEEQHTLYVFTSRNWKVMDSFPLQPNEHVLECKVVNIFKPQKTDEDEDSEDANPQNLEQQASLQLQNCDRPQAEKLLTESDLLPVIVVSTGFFEGEDASSKGRLLLFDYEAQISESGETVMKLDLIGFQVLKGVGSSVCELNGYIACGVGPTINIYFYNWQHKQLSLASFFDTEFYTMRLNSIKNYLVYTDVLRSVHFLRWREKGHRLILLSKDYNNEIESLDSEMMVFDDMRKKLGIVAFDANQNITIFEYKPSTRESIEGKKLLCAGNFFIGSNISRMVRTKRVAASEQKDLSADQQNIMIGTTEGQIGFLIPLNENQFRILSTLQGKLFSEILHNAGLNPKSYRELKPQIPTIYSKIKPTVIDGNLVSQFEMLSEPQQKVIAKGIGANTMKVFNEIANIHAQSDL